MAVEVADKQTIEVETSMLALVRRVGKSATLGVVLIGASAFTLFHGLSNANRPHEIRGKELSLVLLVAHVALALTIARWLSAIWRARKSERLKAKHMAVLSLALLYLALVAAILSTVAFVAIADGF